MGGAVALGVGEVGHVRKNPLKAQDEVPGHRGVGPLVDGDGRRGVGAADQDQALLDAAVPDVLDYSVGDPVKPGAPRFDLVAKLAT